MDVCGEGMRDEDMATMYGSYGYLESPAYPRPYPPDMLCRCNMSTAADAAIRLTVYDMSIQGAFDQPCEQDWAEVVQDPSGTTANSHIRVCGDTSTTSSGTPLTFQSSRNDLTLWFNTDSTLQKRGFLVKFQAVKGKATF